MLPQPYSVSGLVYNTVYVYSDNFISLGVFVLAPFALPRLIPPFVSVILDPSIIVCLYLPLQALTANQSSPLSEFFCFLCFWFVRQVSEY